MKALLLMLGVATAASAQGPFHQPPVTNPEWTQSFAPFRIAGNLFYVGTYDLASYLITTPKGHILINTGTAGSGAMIRSHVEQLGFKTSDIKILLATHNHWDHVSDLADVKRVTGAQLMMNEADAAVLERGGPRGELVQFEPVHVDRRLKDGDTVALGDVALIVHSHPGHTPGATSFSFVTRDSARAWRVLLVNLGSLVGNRLVGNTAYPNIAADYQRTFTAQRQLEGTFDIWVSSHASQFDLHTKYKPGDGYRPAAFVDPKGYAESIDALEQAYKDELKRQRSGT